MEDEAKCVAERDRGLCICGGAGGAGGVAGGAGGAGGKGAALAGSLADVRRAYEERIAAVLASHRSDKLQLQVSVLEEWVRDVTAQNALLATTVEELETTVAGLVPERRRLTETACELRVEVAILRRRLARRDADQRALLEVLRRLRDADRHADPIHFNDVTKSEIFGPQMDEPTQLDQGDSKVSCDRATALQTLNDKLEKDNLKKEREIKRLRRELQEREKTCAQGPPANAGCTLVVTTSEAQVSAKLCECGPGLSSAAPSVPEPDREAREHQHRVQELEDKLKAASAAGVRLRDSVRALRAACAARDRRVRAAAQHSHFRDLIVHELCRQLRAAKAQCVGGPGRGRATSSPRSPRALNATDDDVRLVDRSPSPPLLVSDASLDEGSPVLLCRSAASVADLRRSEKHTKRETPSATEDQLEQQKRPAPELKLQKQPAKELKLQKRPATEEHLKKETKPDKREGEDTKELSTEPVSLASSTDSTRASRAEDQLHTTMQILKNKEETVRVQAESLALAEARIADLTRRLNALAHNDRTDRDEPPRTRECSISCCVNAADDDTSAHLEGEEVGALRDKLATVEGLYRETFYEMARQGGAMDALRRANAQLRSRERRHTARYRELAAEVERLKCDVNDVIGSNSDSGVWGAGSARAGGDVAASTCGETVAGDSGGGAGQGAEYSGGGAGVGGGVTGEGPEGGAGEVAGGLRHVAGQLRRLRDMLACECSCGLAEENKRLKLANDSLEREMRELRERVRQLEQSVRDKDSLLHKYEQLGGGKETHDSGAVDALSSQLQLLHGVLNEKSSQLQSAEGKTQRLRERLKKMDSVAKENVAVREELSQLSLQVERLRRAGEGAGRTHAPARRNQVESLPDQESFIDLRREQPCTLDGPCARVQARRQERETDRCTRVRAGRQQRLSEEACSQCGSDCPIAPPVPPRRFTKKKNICKDQDCWCDADCDCQVGTCAELHSACSHLTRPPRRGHRSASETLERVATSREAVHSARLRWRRRATTHS